MKNSAILQTVTVLLAVCIQYHGILAFPNGAPAGQCGAMTPDRTAHNADPQTSSFPYTITITPANFTNGTGPQNLTIRIQGKSNTDTIRGILLQARDAFAGNSATLGSFVTPLPTSIKPLACTSANGAVTHNTPLADVNSLTFEWSSSTANHVKFFVTVVKSKQVFWTLQESDIVYNPNTSIPSVTTPNPSPSLPDFTSTGCGITKGCYRDSNCEPKKCKFFLSFQPNSSDNTLVDFEISGRTSDLSGTGGFWVAVGFSTDQTMGNDYVNDCIYNTANLQTKAGESENQASPKDNIAFGSSTGAFINGKGSYADGLVRCTFTRKISVSSNSKVNTLDSASYLLVARGPAVAGSKQKHQVTAFSAEALKTTDIKINLMGSGRSILLAVHGILMVLAWMVTSTLGIILARYFKPHWPNSKLCGEKVWFAIHRFLMITTFLFTCTAFVLIFVHVKGFSSVTGDPVYASAHPILGIIVTALCITNPIMAIFRPHPGEDNRVIFNWAHFTVGFIAQILGITNILIGVNMEQADVPKWTTWIVVGFVIAFVVTIILLEVIKFSTTKRDTDPTQQYELHKPHESSNIVPPPPQAPSGTTYYFLTYITYACVTIVIAVLVAVIIGLGTAQFEST